MIRVATFGNYQAALLDLMNAQLRGAEAQERVSTQKIATDLNGFGRQSETLTARKGARSRIQGFIDTAEAVTARLTTQDLALTRVGDGVAGIRQAVANVLATDYAGSLMQELEGHFQAIRGGLNMRHHGNHLFSGAKVNTPPVTVGSLAELQAAPDVASIFANDDLRTVSRVAEGTELRTGFLAEDVGTDVMEILREIQNFHTGADGPLDGRLTQPQKEFLEGLLGRLDAAATAVVEKTAQTGLMHNQVEDLTKAHESQLLSLDELVSKRTDADMAKAVTDLQLSQIAIQASAQVIGQLRQVSLLNYLS